MTSVFTGPTTWNCTPWARIVRHRSAALIATEGMSDTQPNPAALTAERAEIEKVLSLQKARKIAVCLALGLLVVTLLKPNGTLVVLRSILWASASVMCVLEAQALGRMGQKASYLYLNSVFYFGLVVFAFFAGR
jgi:hypothetical protein